MSMTLEWTAPYTTYWPLFERSGLTEGMTREEFAQVIESFDPVVQDYKRGSHIYTVGDPAQTFGFVLYGDVIVSREKPVGHRMIVDIFEPGTILGVSVIPSAFEDWFFDYIAKTSCTIMHIPSKHLLTTEPTVAGSRAQLLLNFLRLTSEMSAKAFFGRYMTCARSIRERISNYIYANLTVNGGHKIYPLFTREELADYLCIPKTSLVRELAKMRDDGIISYDRHSITVMRPEYFQEFVF